LLVLGIILTMLAALLIYRRKRDSAPAAVVAAQVG
jgi:hypothetical protein